MDSPTSGSTNPPPLPGQSSTPPATPPVPSTPPTPPPHPTPPVVPSTPTPIVPPPIPPTTPPPPPTVPSAPVHTPPAPVAPPPSTPPSTPPSAVPHPTPPPSGPVNPPAPSGSLVVPPALGGDKKEDEDKPLVPPLSPPPTGSGPDSLSKPSSDHGPSLTGAGGGTASGSEPTNHDKPGGDLPQIGAAPTESRMTHEVSPDETPKKGHKSLAVIIIVGVILLALGGVAYAASSCSISIPGLSSLFGCDTNSSLTTDQGFTESTTP